ncbi:MAG TPA: CHRD domain-containing protein [Blastocatellia bacterium]|nr:CHRD domain-containing protein [Blastocatellia bacterium]
MTFTRFFRVMAFVAVVLFMAIPTKADPITFIANLTGSQEVPPQNTSATGFATLILNDNGTATISLTINGVVDQTAAHIHGGAVGVNGPVLFPLPNGSFTNFSLGTLTALQIERLSAGLWYVNVHNTAAPGGIIRGQLTAIPEPSTLLLLGTGLLTAVGVGRRKKNQG